MSPAEKRLRATLRARAWDFLSHPEATDPPPGEVAETVGDEDREVVLVFRRKGAAPSPPPPALSFEPVQRFLPGMGLTALESVVIAVLLAVSRMTTAPLLDAVRKELSRQAGKAVAVGEAAFKVYLARLTDQRVGVLDNDRAAKPPGYGLTPEYRHFVTGHAPPAAPVRPAASGTPTPAKTA